MMGIPYAIQWYKEASFSLSVFISSNVRKDYHSLDIASSTDELGELDGKYPKEA